MKIKSSNTVLVTPICAKTGNVAPSMVIEVNKSQKDWETKAIEDAKKKTPLSKFSNWGFVVQ